MRKILSLVLGLALAMSATGAAVARDGDVLVAQAPPKGTKKLTKDDVIKMSKAGIPDSVIIGKISKSGTVFNLEVSEIVALKKAGVSEKVIEAMVNTEMNEGRPETTKKPSGTGTPRAGRTPTPPPSEEEEILGVTPPTDAPEEGGVWGGAAGGNMAQAAALYRDGKWDQASDMLFGLLEAGRVPPKDVPEMQKRLADCLYAMGLFQSALYYYQDAVEGGAYASGLPRTIELSDRLKDDRKLLQMLDAIKPGDIPAELRRDAGYFYGQLYFRKAQSQEPGTPGYNDEVSRAKKALGAVPKDSKFYGRAKYTEGVIQSVEGSNEAALNAFREAIAAGDGANAAERNAKGNVDAVEQQARLAIGRTLYQAEKYDQAVNAFREISRDGTRWGPSLFENAWALHRDKEYGFALGNILSTKAPFFESFYEPEGKILEAIVYYRLCLFPQASATINSYFQQYAPVHAKIKAFRKQAAARPPEQVFAFLKDFVDSPKGKAASFMPSDLMLAVAEDGKIADILYHLQAIEFEQQKIRDIGAWRSSRVAAAVMDQMNGHKASLQKLGGRLVLNEFEVQDNKLDELNAQAKNIRFEITLGEKEALEASLLGKEGGTATSTGKLKDVAVIVPDDHYFWPFEGEYWKDEVGYYKFAVEGSCNK